MARLDVRSDRDLEKCTAFFSLAVDCRCLRVSDSRMEGVAAKDTTLRGVQVDTAADVDEEEEYMKSLNAALLIQTPLQVLPSRNCCISRLI